MAEIQTTQLINDLTGKPLDRENHTRIQFSVDGKHYQIDLDHEGAELFHESIREFVENAAPVKADRKARVSRPSAGSGEQTKMREWAKANGYEVAERGRIPASIQEAYAAAN
ncbi:MAG: Lsr2 family protein [Arthrobacter sp.]|jgi:hypothetical protein|nr:Lsr2 family protein [Arthrobacter sp.]